MKFMSFIPAWWLLQTAATKDSWAEYGIGIVMVGVITALWREDRKTRVDAFTILDKNYNTLAMQLKDIISGNTTAMVSLADQLKGKVSNCPMMTDPAIASWIRAIAESSRREDSSGK